MQTSNSPSGMGFRPPASTSCSERQRPRAPCVWTLGCTHGNPFRRSLLIHTLPNTCCSASGHLDPSEGRQTQALCCRLRCLQSSAGPDSPARNVLAVARAAQSLGTAPLSFLWEGRGFHSCCDSQTALGGQAKEPQHRKVAERTWVMCGSSTEQRPSVSGKAEHARVGGAVSRRWRQRGTGGLWRHRKRP